MTDAELTELRDKVQYLQQSHVADTIERDERRRFLDDEIRGLKDFVKEAFDALKKEIGEQRKKLFGNGTMEGSVCYEIKHHGEELERIDRRIDGFDGRLKLIEDQDKRITALETKSKLPAQALSLILQLATLVAVFVALAEKMKK